MKEYEEKQRKKKEKDKAAKNKDKDKEAKKDKDEDKEDEDKADDSVCSSGGRAGAVADAIQCRRKTKTQSQRTKRSPGCLNSKGTKKSRRYRQRLSHSLFPAHSTNNGSSGRDKPRQPKETASASRNRDTSLLFQPATPQSEESTHIDYISPQLHIQAQESLCLIQAQTVGQEPKCDASLKGQCGRQSLRAWHRADHPSS